MFELDQFATRLSSVTFPVHNFANKTKQKPINEEIRSHGDETFEQRKGLLLIICVTLSHKTSLNFHFGWFLLCVICLENIRVCCLKWYTNEGFRPKTVEVVAV